MLDLYNDQYGLDFALARYTADGALDSSFRENGNINRLFSFKPCYIYKHLQGNKIVAAGYTLNDDILDNDFALARYNVDGTLDASFGENGKVTTDFNNSYDHRQIQ